MWYLFHGSDEFSAREALEALRAESDYGYNQDIFKGTEAALADLIGACETFPFLSDQRLVVLEGLPKKSASRKAKDASSGSPAAGAPAGAATDGQQGEAQSAARKKGSKKGRSASADAAAFIAGLAEFLPNLPETTTLVILADEALEAGHPLMQAAKQGGTARQFTTPTGATLEHWIDERAKRLGNTITTEACKMLALYAGHDLRLLASELEKLSIYTGQGGRIDARTVRTLTPVAQQTRIFDLTDALARQERAQALTILHELLDQGEAPIGLTAFIGSQVRSLLLVKDLSERGLRAPQIAETAGLNPYVVTKTLPLVRRFSFAQLKAAYRSILGVDTALKRSRMPAELALDLLVIEFGQEPRPIAG
jgi:DNA polymerase-3 subunit delta